MPCPRRVAQQNTLITPPPPLNPKKSHLDRPRQCSDETERDHSDVHNRRSAWEQICIALLNTLVFVCQSIIVLWLHFSDVQMVFQKLCCGWNMYMLVMLGIWCISFLCMLMLLEICRRIPLFLWIRKYEKKYWRSWNSIKVGCFLLREPWTMNLWMLHPILNVQNASKQTLLWKRYRICGMDGRASLK